MPRNPFGQALSANNLFNQAISQWKERQRCLLEDDDEGATRACIEVIRLCQLLIQADQHIGDAYVLLANALLSSALHVQRHTNPDLHEFVTSGGAAVIHLWHSFPHRGYPFTKRKDTGDQLWRTTINQLMQDRSLAEQDVIALMDFWRDNFAASAVSPTSFQNIQARLQERNTDHLHDKSAELRAIAIQYQLDANELLDEIADSMEVASHLAKQSVSLGDTTARWWVTFLTEWGRKCFVIWVHKCGDSKDYGRMQNLWLHCFEPLWAVGCDIARIDRLNNMRKAVSLSISHRPEPVAQSDKEKLSQWLNVIDQAASETIDSFTKKQRQAITQTLKQLSKYDEDSTEGKLARLMRFMSD